ncbi:hypothetical protein DFH09DRAFT_1332085 [Mycena vulgaris]|nr:hypothetical protein DFH09DRAFT_1332085 [Mycena vulgaris]
MSGGTGRPRGRPIGSKNRKRSPVDTSPKPRANGRKKQKLDIEEVGTAVDLPVEQGSARPRQTAAPEEPGNPDKPRTKRTHEAVEAEKAQKAADVAARVQRREAAIAELAAIDAEQYKEAAEAEENSVLTIGDLTDNDMDLDDEEPILEFAEEGFNRVDNDEAHLSDDEYQPKTKAVAPKVKKLTKPARGETRAAIENSAKALTQAAKKKDPGALKRGIQNSDAAAASKKAGVSKHWTQVNAAKADSPPPSPALGGLEDSDARATRPEGNESQPIIRQNELVTICGSSDEEDTPTRVPERPAKSSAPVHKARKSTTALSKIPALHLGRTATPMTAGRARAVVAKPPLKSESSGTFSFTPPSHADVKGLPAFLSKTWASRYLPAIYRAFTKVQDPMAFATTGFDVDKPGGETVGVLQDVLDELYPRNEWVIEWADCICAKAVARIAERRSLIGKAGLKAVDEGFEGIKYYGSLAGPTPGSRLHEVVRADAEYALRPTGPALFKVPTPASCTLRSRDAGYIKPGGFMESDVFVTTIKPYIKGEQFRIIPITVDGKQRADVSTLPIGALALAAAAVERGYKLHSTGERATNIVLDFSSSHFGTVVSGYVKGIKNFTPSRWEVVLKACGATIAEDDDEPASPQANTLDGVREHMYVPSSP